MERRRSEVWKFFEFVSGRRVKCNFCEQICSSVTTNMKKHLVTKHPTANEILIKIDLDEDAARNLSDQDDSSDALLTNTNENLSKVEMIGNNSQSETVQATSRKRSLIWKFFDVVNDKAKCKFCGRELSAIISNMKKHLRVQHPRVNDVGNDSTNSNEDHTIITKKEPENNFSGNEKPACNNPGKRSLVWEFFEQIDDKRAFCTLCNQEQSCVTSNMKIHLEKKHSGQQIYMTTAPESKPFDERFNEADSNDSFNYPEETPTLSTSSTTKVASDVPQIDVHVKKDPVKPKLEQKLKTENRYSGDQKLMERKRSSVWHYFEIISANRATCNICGKEQSSVISNVKKHLVTSHPEAHQEMIKGCKPRKTSINNLPKRPPPTPISTSSSILSKKRRQIKQVSYAESDSNDIDTTSQDIKPSSTKSTSKHQTPNKPVKTNKFDTSSSVEIEEEIIQPSTTSQISDKVADKADQILLKLIIKHYQDYGIVQDSKILKFIKTINKSYKLPSKDSIGKTLIPDLHEKCMFQTKLKVKSCKKYCMTIDCWSNIHDTNFITVTVHYVNDQFVLNTILLDCSVIQKQDTPANLAQELASVLKNWNLSEEDAILAVLDSSVSNIKCVFTEELKWDAQDCFVNIINSIAKESFSNEWIQIIIEKIKDLVNYFKGCEFSTENLIEFQKRFDISPLKLTKDYPRCWHSTFQMLQRFINLEDAIKHCLNLIDKELQTLSILEWEVVSQLVNCVKPMDHVMTTIKKGPNYCPASLAVPLINGLKNVYNNLATKDLHNPVKDVINNITQSISDNFDGIENVEQFIIATFLDPRFKNKAFSSQIIGDQVRDKVVNILNAEESCSFQNKRPAQIDENDPQIEFWSFFQDSTNTRSNNSQSSRIIIEVQRYLEDGVVSRLEDPLVWWSKNHVMYPRLAELAKERLCCVASSIPCHRYFSKKGQTSIDNRSRLSTKKTQMLVFLNANYVTEDI